MNDDFFNEIFKRMFGNPPDGAFVVHDVNITPVKHEISETDRDDIVEMMMNILLILKEQKELIEGQNKRLDRMLEIIESLEKK